MTTWPQAWPLESGSNSFRQSGMMQAIRRILSILLDENSLDQVQADARINFGDLEILQQQGLTPLLYRELSRTGQDTYLNPDLLDILRRDYVVKLWDALLEDRELLYVSQALIEAGIEIILFKGADLRLRLFGESAVRTMGDMDLLISFDRVQQAKLVLEKLNFKLEPRSHDPRPGFRSKFRQELHFKPPQGMPLLIDLHWKLNYVANFYNLPYDLLNSKAIPWKIGDLSVKVLSPEHAVILLALNTFEPNEHMDVRQIIDLALAIHYFPIDWQCFVDEVRHFRCQVPVYLVLKNIFRLLGKELPEPLTQEIDNYPCSLIELIAMGRLFGYFTHHLFCLYQNPNLKDWAFYIGSLLWPRPEYLIINYGYLNRTRYLHQFLSTLFSSAQCWVPW